MSDTDNDRKHNWVNKRIEEMEEKTENDGFNFHDFNDGSYLAGDDAYSTSLSLRLREFINTVY